MKSLPCPRYCNDFHIFFFFFSSPRLIDGMYALLSQYQGENNNALTSIALNSTGVQKHYNNDSLFCLRSDSVFLFCSRVLTEQSTGEGWLMDG